MEAVQGDDDITDNDFLTKEECREVIKKVDIRSEHKYSPIDQDDNDNGDSGNIESGLQMGEVGDDVMDDKIW